MFKEVFANINDVDTLLDFKLDIIFNSAEVLSMDKNEMEKTVNYCEEEIRENINKYKILFEKDRLVAAYYIDDYSNGKMIDFIYVVPDKRRSGVGNYILNNIINGNYKVLYAWVHKENEAAEYMLKKNNFIVDEETEYKFLMKNSNEKEENERIKIQLFKNDVEILAKKYGVNYKLEC